MVSPRKALLFGVLIWLIAFLVAFAIYPIRESYRPLFESIMPVVLTLGTVFFAHRYLKGVQAGAGREGLLIGLLWMATNIIIDLPLMLSPSPMQMTLADYFADIGVTYALIPIITTGMGFTSAQAGEGASSGSVAESSD